MDAKTKKTLAFSVVMVAVLAVFIVLGTMPGPPAMPPLPQHQGLKDDQACLACHHWADHVPAGATLPKALGPKHPPARPKKVRPQVVDGGVVTPTGPQWECLKCHAPK